MSAVAKTSTVDQQALKEILETSAPSGYTGTMSRRGQRFSVKVNKDAGGKKGKKKGKK